MPLHWRPVGPLPASTYWWRRAGALAAVVVVLVLVWLVLPGGGGSPDRLAATGTPSPRPSASATTSSGAPASASPSASGVGECPDDALAIDATTDAPSYPTGARAALAITVKNTSSTPCRRALGFAAVELTITSGADRIWSSADCTPATDSGETVLAPGATSTVRAAWPGTRSASGCPGGQPAAQPGTYRLSARVGDLRVPGSVFTVTG